MANLIMNGFPVYTDIDGEALDNGFIFIGEPGLNPISNPKQAYWDSALTVPASNIRTIGGYPSFNGSPGRLYVDGGYSIQVQDKHGAVVYTQLDPYLFPEEQPWPIGATYIQFPGDSDPATLGLPGTWSNVSAELAGDFIRFEGGEASGFGGGQQGDAMQRITGSFITRNTDAAGDIVTSSFGVFSDGGDLSAIGTVVPSAVTQPRRVVNFNSADSTTPNIAKTNEIETRPVNRTVRKWRRTA